jgi:hypothetical protein
LARSHSAWLAWSLDLILSLRGGVSLIAAIASTDSETQRTYSKAQKSKRPSPPLQV